jgi:hypothetical protein
MIRGYAFMAAALSKAGAKARSFQPGEDGARTATRQPALASEALLGRFRSHRRSVRQPIFHLDRHDQSALVVEAKFRSR